MSTYDITSATISALAVGDVLNCPYTGSVAQITLPSGRYKLEVWGASGGTYSSTSGTGGKGGYSKGTLNLVAEKAVYCYAGGQGTANTNAGTTAHDGGFNGGGGAYSRASGGGGGSDIRIGEDSLYARVIVAGGGGGAAYSNNNSYYSAITGGAGGGESGGNGGYGNQNQTNSSYSASAGTQTAAGADSSSAGNYATEAKFGSGARGGYYSQSYAAGGGGGGWYGGGVGRNYYAAGAGGSGYVYTTSTKGDYPSGCLLDDSMLLTDAETTIGTSSFPSTSNGTETGHDGNGYVRITVLDLYVGATFDVEASSRVDGVTISPASATVAEGGSVTFQVSGDITNVVVKDNGVDITSMLRQAESGLVSSTPVSYTTSGSIRGTNYQAAVGKGSDATSATGNDYCQTQNSTAYIDYTFDFSAIPEGVTISSVAVSVKGHCESTSSSSEVARLQLYSGTTAKGNSLDFSSTTDQVVSMSTGTWTREELQDAILRFTIVVMGVLTVGAKGNANAEQARRIFDKAYSMVFGQQGASFHYDVNIIGFYKTSGDIWYKGKKSKFSDERVDAWNDGTTAYMVYRKKKVVEIHDAASDKKDKYSGKFKFTLDDFDYSMSHQKDGILLVLKQRKGAKGTIKEVKAVVDEKTCVPKNLRVKVFFFWTTIAVSNFKQGGVSDQTFVFPRKRYASGYKFVDKR